MAEQNTDEAKSHLARRGARPFTGPAGVPASTGSPVLRPATPSSRPARGPFAPLGSRPATSRGAVVQPAVPSGAPSASLAARDAELTMVVPESSGSGVTAALRAPALEAPALRAPALEAPALSATADESTHAGAADEVRLPVREEIEARAPSDAALSTMDLDAIDAGLEVLAAGEAVAPDRDVGEPLPEVATTAEDSTAADWDSSSQIPSADEVVAAPPDPPLVIAPDMATAPPALADMDEGRSLAAVAAEPAPSTALAEVTSLLASVAAAPEAPAWPDPLLAEYAPYVPPPESPSGGAFVPVDAAVSQAMNPGPEFRIAAALDRLAERVRCGEIPVSSVAPEANDAAVLASVLAALLGGASRR